MLLNILVWVVVLVVLGFLTTGTLQRRAGLRDKIALLEKQIPQFTARAADGEALRAQRQRLEEDLAAERDHYYEAGRIDPYRFGIVVRELLLARRLRILKYQTLESGQRTLLEFAVEGSALELMSFLQAVSKSEKYWSISFLSISARRGNGEVEAVFRVGYETLEPLDS
jgi:hypothetical protein